MSRALIPLVLVSLTTLLSCNNKEVERLKFENDSLRAELAARSELELVMRNVDALIDSIDITRSSLRQDLGEGITYENYESRLRDINQYIASTQQQLSKVEKQLGAANRKSNTYAMMLEALRTEFALRMEEVASLETDVANYKTENDGLLREVKSKDEEITHLKKTVTAKDEQVTKLDAQVKEMTSTVKSTEAESFYARARSIEEVANKTRLAPRKKKDTYREALELYKKSLSLGKTEAEADIKRLEEKIK